MTREEHNEFWRPARLNVEKNHSLKRESYNASKRLAEILGLDYPVLAYWFDIPLTDELKRKLVLLASPHSKAIEKVLQVRKDDASRKLNSD